MTLKKNPGISNSLIAAFICSFVLIFSISIFLITHNRKVTQTLESDEKHFKPITSAATQISSFAKRAEGHIMLYLSFHKQIDRQKVPKRLASLKEQIMILDRLVKDDSARQVVEKIKSAAAKVPSITYPLLNTHDKEYETTSNFKIINHQKEVLAAHDIFSKLRKLGVELTELELSLENVAKTQVLDNAATLRISLYIIVGSVIIFILFIGILMVRNNQELNREISDRKKAELHLKHSYETQAAVNKLLGDSLDDSTVMELLQECLNLIISLPWLTFESKGSIFLIEDAPDILIMKVQHGFSDELIEKCSIVPFGNCLCGKAAATKKIIFSDHIARDHTYRFDNTEDHGHYCVPIASKNKIFGIINIYVKPGHKRKKFEEDFLVAISNTLARQLIQKYAQEDKQRIEAQLHQSQKLESIGQLAGGIAHEINTPIQYIGDNTTFLEDAFQDITEVVQTFELLLDTAKKGPVAPQFLKKAQTILENADLEYLKEEIPETIKQSIEGLKHVSKIVTSMKEFAHPSNKKMEQVDINHALENTITVTKNNWNSMADMTREFDPSLPPVMCNPGELNQVFLSIIINAVHSIKMANKNKPDKKGQIRIRTSYKDELVTVSISDSGTGIPKAIRSKVFDPFFTTKEIGKGTGQSLAVSHSIITEKHQGRLFFKTREEKGTTFIIELPVHSV